MAGRRATLAAVGELAFLERVLRQLNDGGAEVDVGPGDDCAVLRFGARRVLLTIDALVEGIHFEPGWHTPRQLGERAFAVNASDVAAMGGEPRWVLVALTAPSSYVESDLRVLQDGIVRAARRVGAQVIGGNLTAAKQLSVTITLLGECAHPPLQRAGAKPGDAVFVTGTLGDSALGVRMLQGRVARRASVIRRFLQPQPRLQAGRVLSQRRLASAAIDVSDGLLQDLAHICAASGVGANLTSASLPLSPGYRRTQGKDRTLALCGGEDYELLFTVPPAKLAKLSSHQGEMAVAITRIGTITEGGAVLVDGEAPRGVRGFDHFRRHQRRTT